MVHERNELCDICGYSVSGIWKLLCGLFTDGMFQGIQEKKSLNQTIGILLDYFAKLQQNKTKQ